MFHHWGFQFDLSIGSKHFSFLVLIFLLQGACLVRKTSQHESQKCFLPIENSYRSSVLLLRDENYHFGPVVTYKISTGP